MINWTATNEEVKAISKIAARAQALNHEYGFTCAMMDIEACHCNGNKLNLTGLLEADDFNFAHDVFGIANNIDRDTGKLLNCFLPRFSA